MTSVNVQSTLRRRHHVGQHGRRERLLSWSRPTPAATAPWPGSTALLAIDEGTGSNRLEVSEAAATIGDTVFMTNSLIYSNAVGGFKAISYQATGGTFGGGVALSTGPGNDTVNVQSTRADATTTVTTGRERLRPGFIRPQRQRHAGGNQRPPDDRRGSGR